MTLHAGAARRLLLSAAVVTCLMSAGCLETFFNDLENAGNRTAGPYKVRAIDADSGAPVPETRVSYRYFFADPVLGVNNKYATLTADEYGTALVPEESNPAAAGEPDDVWAGDRNFLRVTFRAKAPDYEPGVLRVTQGYWTSKGREYIALAPAPPSAPVTEPPSKPEMPKEPVPKAEPPKDAVPKPETPKEPVPELEEREKTAPTPEEPADSSPGTEEPDDAEAPSEAGK